MGYRINKDGSVSRNGKFSILERYPEYNFKPSTLYDKRSLIDRCLLVWFVIGLCLFCVLFYSTLFYIYKVHLSMPPMVIQVVVWPLIICCVAAIFLLLFLIWYKRRPTLSQQVDYIQSIQGISICVKDGKFGVLNNFNNKLIVPTIYDKLIWTQKDKLLRAELQGESFLIDIYNNRLK